MNKTSTSFINKILEFCSKNLAWVMFTLIMIYFTTQSDTFLTYTNITNILSQNAYLIVASLGITFVMMSGQMDLSAGYIISTANVICAKLMVQAGWPIWLSILVTILFCIVLTTFNATIANKLNITLIMVTIGTMAVLQGTTFVLSNSRAISGFSDAFKFIGQGKIFNFPVSVIIAGVLFLIVDFVLSKTYFGRYVYAVGANPEAARLAGINVQLVRLAIAILEGLFIGIATVMLIARLGTAQSAVGPGTEFSVITGIFLGGVSIRGGEGKITGVLAGILCVAVLSNGMQMANINTHYQYIVKGLIMLLAIGFDVYQLNRRNNKILKARVNKQ